MAKCNKVENIVKKYIANREWTKKLKFNNNWYVLKAMYDNLVNGDQFDFNAALNDKNNIEQNLFDFNAALNETIEDE